MSELSDAIAEMTDAIAAQSQAIFTLEKKVDKQNERLSEFVPKRRFAGTTAAVLVAGAMVAASSLWGDREANALRRRDRVAGVSRAYANCSSTNRAFDGVDKGYLALAQQALANAEGDDERVERTKESLRRLRSGLNRTDCDGLLVTLSPADGERVKAEVSRTLPTLPLPPTPFD